MTSTARTSLLPGGVKDLNADPQLAKEVDATGGPAAALVKRAAGWPVNDRESPWVTALTGTGQAPACLTSLSALEMERTVLGDEHVPVFLPEGLLRPSDVTRGQKLRSDAGERLCQRRWRMGVPLISAVMVCCGEVNREDLERHISEGERGKVPFDRLTVPCGKKGTGRRVVHGHFTPEVPAAEPDHGPGRGSRLANIHAISGSVAKYPPTGRAPGVLLADGQLEQEDGLHGPCGEQLPD
jgi:hypothetical protein